MWTAPKPHPEAASSENSPISSGPYSERRGLIPVWRPDGKTPHHTLLPLPLPAGPCPFSSYRDSKYISGCKQTLTVLVVKGVSYIGRVWDQFILSKYLMKFNSGCYAGEILQNHISTLKKLLKTCLHLYCMVCGNNTCVNVDGSMRGGSGASCMLIWSQECVVCLVSRPATVIKPWHIQGIPLVILVS